MKEALRTQTIALTVNGRACTVTVHPMKRLLDVLRDDIGLTGTKEGCGEGECGACSAIMDGQLVATCMIPACQADGTTIVTIEGLTTEGGLNPVQKAFCEHGGTQCGICTPGMIVAAAYYIENPGEAESAREALAGNQCRCTGYTGILESVKAALAGVKANSEEQDARTSS